MNQQQQDSHSQKIITEEKEVNVEQLVDDTPENEKFIEENLQLSKQYKLEGNSYFAEDKSQQAINKYQMALQYTEQFKIKSILYSNISIVLIKQKQFNNAINYCKKSLKHNPKYIKPLLNLAQCHENQQKFQQALQLYKQAQAIQHSEFIEKKIKQLKKKTQQINQQKKKQVIDGLKNIGNSFLGYFGMSLDNFKMQQGNGGGYNISFKQ